MESIIESLREFVRRQGWTIEREQAIQHGRQLWVSDGVESVPVALYTTGKALIQGRPGALRSALQGWWQSHAGTQPAAAPGAALPRVTGEARIGSDEAGKGDYFGPLVIAALYADADTERQLLDLGVRDSKLLTDERMLAIAGTIKAACPHGLVILRPERYNQLYERFRNLDRLLAWGHAEAIGQIMQQVRCERAIADQFARESVLEEALRERGLRIALEQRPRAESDLAVAAASIVARAAFVRWIDLASQRLCLSLPKGASDPTIVEIGRRVVDQGGPDLLAKVAKMHFKTTAAILRP